MNKRYFRLAILLGATAVALGALGAHAFENILAPESLRSFETAVRYQLFHAVLLLAVCFASDRYSLIWTQRFLVFGTMSFSGSIYLLLLNEQLKWGINFLWPFTPLGGIALIIGWLSLLVVKPIEKG